MDLTDLTPDFGLGKIIYGNWNTDRQDLSGPQINGPQPSVLPIIGGPVLIKGSSDKILYRINTGRQPYMSEFLQTVYGSGPIPRLGTQMGSK